MISGDTAIPLIPYPAAAQSAPDVRLHTTSRILTSAASEAESHLLADAIAARTGLRLEVVVGHDAVAGDILLVLGPGDLDEGYGLRTDAGHVRITASTPTGAYWATQTLRQLLAPDTDGWSVRGAIISDAPRFAYRGAMLDVARHFFSVADVRRYIDLISAYKVNALHLHLTDDQGWRLEIPGWPRLTEVAAATAVDGGVGGFYTAADFAEIVAHAASRHMTIVPEIDTPGHTHAVSVAYPEFAERPVISDAVREQASELGQDLPEYGEAYTGWGVGFSSVRIGDEATEAFIGDVFRHVASISPGPWIHLGGDECLGISAEDFSSFVRRAAATILSADKTPIAWHEAGKVSDLPAGTVGQYWGFRTPEGDHAAEARAFVDAGGALIMSPSDAAYLDMKYDEHTRIGLDWADGPTSVESSYAWDPAMIVEGIDDSDILGVEAPLWTETVRTPADIETLAFPRLPGIAEIGWSPRDGVQRRWPSLRSRLAAQEAAWVADSVHFHRGEDIAW